MSIRRALFWMAVLWLLLPAFTPALAQPVDLLPKADIEHATAFKDAYAKAKQGDVWSMLWLNDQMAPLECAPVFWEDSIKPLLKKLSDAGDPKGRLRYAKWLYGDWADRAATEDDEALGVRMLEDLAAQKNPLAMMELASMSSIQNTPRERELYIRALPLLKALAAKGDLAALWALDRSAGLSLGGFVTTREQFAWLQQACDGGDTEAMCEYCESYRDSPNVEEVDRAIRYLETAIQAGEWRAVLLKGQLLEKGDCPRLPQDLAAAMVWYKRFETMTGTHELTDELADERSGDYSDGDEIDEDDDDSDPSVILK